MKRTLHVGVLASLILLPALASAQTTVTILGLRSAAADEAFAQAMTDALRQAAEAAGSATLRHTGRENELGQLMLVFGCDDPTSDCLHQIGESLESDRLVHGTVSRSGRSGGYSVTLALFNVDTSDEERTLQEVIPDGVTTTEALVEPASRFYAALTGSVVQGELAILCDQEDARILVNGEEVGEGSPDPIVLRELEPGSVVVTVEHEDFAPYEETVQIAPGRLVEHTVELQPAGSLPPPGGGEPPPPGGGEPDPAPARSLAWLGWTSLGLGVAFGGLGLMSSLLVNDINEGDNPLRDARESIGEQFEDEYDLCHPASNAPPQVHTASGEQNVQNECSSGQLFNTLQFVFYGLSAVAVGVGIYIIIREAMRSDDEGDDDEASARRWSLHPVALNGGGAVAASLSF